MDEQPQVNTKTQSSPRPSNQPKHQLAKSKYALKKRARKFTTALLAGESQEQALISAGYANTTARTGDCAILTNPAHIKPFISILEKQGVTDNFLAEKTRSLLDAKKTEYFQRDGMVTDEREVPALETQRKTLELATKLKGHLKEQSQGDINIGLMQMVVQAVRSGEE